MSAGERCAKRLVAEAVALEDPSMFAGYARWLASLLTRAEISSRFPADETAAALPALEATLAALASASAARPGQP